MKTLSSLTALLFYSYAHEDEYWRKELDKHLTLMKREGLIASWHDRNISAGAEWKYEIDQHLNDAQIILLLVSSDFIASDYCYSIEAERALKRHEAGDAVVIPIILRPVDWQTSPFGKLLALPSEGKAVTTWENRDQAFTQIARGLRKAIEQVHNDPSFHAFSPALVQPFWTVPYRRNLLFTGREEFLEQIHTSLCKTETSPQIRALALSGLGGTGKTQLAIEYAYRYQNMYQAVLWVNAATHDTLVTDFTSLSDLLHLPARNEKDQNLVIKTVKRWLTEHDQWLLILDNADHPNLVYDFLPVKYNGHILLTTRAQIVGAVAQVVEVDVMNEEEATELLLSRAKIVQHGATLDHVPAEDYIYAQMIAATMGRLPLALDQAGAYIEETGCGVADYLERYGQRKVALLKRRGGGEADHPDSVLTTWSLSFEEIERNDPAAADLLRFFAFLDPDAIPQELITTNTAAPGSSLQPLAKDLSLLDEAIAHLRLFSLIRRNRINKTFSVHRLVQSVLKASMNNSSQRLWAKQAIQSVINIFPSWGNITWSQCQRYLPHVHVCIELINEYSLTEIDTTELFYSAGRWLHEHAQYIEAEIFYQRALDMEEKKNGQVGSGLVRILDSLAWLNLDQGVYAKAIPLGQRSLTIKQQIFGSEHPEVAITLHMLGRLHQAQRNFEQAEIFYRQALMIKEQMLGSDHAETATTLLALAWLYQDQGAYDQAEPLLQRTLSIRKRVLGMNHVSTSITLHQLAWLYHEQRRYTEAEPLFQQALFVKEQAIGSKHPFTAITLHAFARFYHDQHFYAKAEELYQRALSIREQVLGLDHPFTAATLHYLAQLYYDQRLYTQAETLYLRALTIREQVLGQDHFLTGTTLYSLAQLYEVQGEKVQADSFYLRTLHTREQVLGHMHPSTIIIAKQYAHLLRTMQREREAIILEMHYNIK